MERRSILLIVAVGAALALPAQGYAVDHVVLDLSPTTIAAQQWPPSSSATLALPTLWRSPCLPQKPRMTAGLERRRGGWDASLSSRPP